MSKQNQLTPEELASCRKHLEQRWIKRKVDETLLARAWQAAYQIANVLYDEFAATQVAAFGSITEPICFTKSSDIDIAVWGLSDDMHSKANDRIWDIHTGFKIDLINYDMTNGRLCHRIQEQAIHIEKGERTTQWKAYYENQHSQFPIIVKEEIYELTRMNLAQRINDELLKIEDTLTRIMKALRIITVASEDVTEFIENTIATDLTDIYSGIERIFQRIANEVDEYLPHGDEWHKKLLQQMSEQRPERPPVISEETHIQLTKLLKFRHKVNNIYGRELRYENTLVHAETIDVLFAAVSQEITAFTESLSASKEDVPHASPKENG